MNKEEIKQLAAECRAIKHEAPSGNYREGVLSFEFSTNELTAYTAAVEARERERCANLMDDLYARGKLQHIGSKYIGGMIRELK